MKAFYMILIVITMFTNMYLYLTFWQDRNTFHRFDKFNAKYNPIGQSSLRDIFIKTDNEVKGVFFAEILKVCCLFIFYGSQPALRSSSFLHHLQRRLRLTWKRANIKMQSCAFLFMAESTASGIIWLSGQLQTKCTHQTTVGSFRYRESSKLLLWTHATLLNKNLFKFVSFSDIFKANKLIDNFAEILYNIFMPLFEVTKDPSSHPFLHKFLFHVSGFDSVDDESKPERMFFNMKTPTPENWTSEENPPYVYYIYYTYANIQSLNNFRRERGMNKFKFRPHCGEAGAVSHLVATFMLSENINHGLMLRKVWIDFEFMNEPLIIVKFWSFLLGTSLAILVLLESNRNRHFTTEQQLFVLELHQKSILWISLDRHECQLVDRWPASIPLHQGAADGGVQHCNTGLEDDASWHVRTGQK